ncbi:C-C motif chemokine 3-like [Struthio camelus]|uniref:C-C motif chemokine 3-like n=1 Tax=Struthio camelus TaxID=8801 RepID=UPI00051E3424|nr:PREDICTED: C-C motif chemokine 3-like [Struthio camelus australis]
MKISVALFTALLIAASCSQTFSTPAGSDLSNCCFSYTTRKLPKRLILRYFSTSSKCSRPGIMFITKKGHQVCANPSDTWVLSYLQNLKQN